MEPAKNRRNVALHGIAFEDAIRIFEGPTVERMDDRFDYDEVRIYAIGLVNGIELRSSTRKLAMKKDASSQRGAPNRTKGARTGRNSSSSGRTASDWTRLRSMTSRQIRSGIESDADARPTDVNFWKTAKLVLPTPKSIVTMRLDDDLLRWFRRHRGYQTRINAILRAYMNAHQES